MRASKFGTNGTTATRTIFLVALSIFLHCGTIAVHASSLFSLAIACVTNIAFNGNGVLIDSFDSSNPNYCDWNTNWGYGTYNFNKASAYADIGTDSTTINAISVGNAQIFGHLNTAPGGTVTVGPNGYVGPWPLASGGIGIQPGYTNDSMSTTFPDVPLPAGANNWTTVSTNNVITNSGNYYISAIATNLVIDAANVNLYVAGSISISGSSAITLTTNVTTAIMYVAGPAILLRGNGIYNATGRASTLQIYGLPAVNSISLTGSSGFTGTIYAPEAAIYISYFGATSSFIGAIVASNVVMSGGNHLHFDEALATNTSSLLLFPVPQWNIAGIAGQNVSLSIPFQGQPMTFQWYSPQANLIAGATNAVLTITNAQLSDAGNYYLAMTNYSGQFTSPSVTLTIYTNVPFAISQPRLNSGGIASFITYSPPGFTVALQASTNLSDWLTISTNNTIGSYTNGWLPIAFHDPQASNSPQRYYRAVLNP